MEYTPTILSPLSYIQLPKGWISWAVWIAFLGLNLFFLYYWKNYNKTWDRTRLLIFLSLLILTPFMSLFVAVNFNSGMTLSPAGIPLDVTGIKAEIFSAVPWMLAGGFLGPLPAAILGLFTGILQAYWDTHSAYTLLTTPLLAILFSVMVCQRYRTWIYRMARLPILAGLFLTLVYPVVYFVGALFFVDGQFIIQLDFAIDHLTTTWLAMGIVLLVGAIFSQLAAIFLSREWGGRGTLVPSPGEKSLQARFLFSIAPIAILLVITLLYGSWFVSGSAARDMMEDQMVTISNSAATLVPYFIQSGQNLISKMASDGRLASASAEQLDSLLKTIIHSDPFFSQLVVADHQGNAIKAYPDNLFSGQNISLQEELGVQLALLGTPNQFYVKPQTGDDSTNQTSFFYYIKDDSGDIQRVLIGRTDMRENPVAEPIILSLQEMNNLHGQGILLEENGLVIFQTDPSSQLTDFSNTQDTDNLFSEKTASDGSRQYFFIRPIQGTNWHVATIAPASQAQQLALRIAAPMMGMIILLSIISVVVFSLGLGIVTSSLETLSIEADDIARGNLDTPLPGEGVDEVGQLRSSFEKMRVSLKARIAELNRLLDVSAGVASNLNLADAVQPVLESALVNGAIATNIVIIPSVFPEFDDPSPSPVAYRRGPDKDLYQYLDDAILEHTMLHERLVATNANRLPWANNHLGQPLPGSLVALPLRHEERYYGALWVAYDQPCDFSEDDIRFLSTLASYTAMAASNSNLFLSAEIGRQRLDAILNSSPDPVLVTDQNNILILANPAAWQLFDLNFGDETGQPIDKVIDLAELLDLFLESSNVSRSVEIQIKPDKVFLAAVSSVVADGFYMGKVCLLRDITQFKELDILKSDFVSTVSHDLRTPITLVRGYATMLEMVGQLNEQQASYQKKIISGMDNMSRLVNNLLDLNRIDAGIGLMTETIAVETIIKGVIEDVRLQAIQKKIHINTEFPSQEPDLQIVADPALLKQALYNLLDNAVKYTKSEGNITVRVQSQPERIIFMVSDTGIGISPMDQPRIFEKFYRGPHTVNQQNPGSGLGLAIVKSIAERHCGKAWVESQLGRGSTFFLAIPRNPNDCNQDFI